MPRTRTPSGEIERGPATQRHFVREIDSLDDVSTVCSFSAGSVAVSTATIEAQREVLAAAAEWGGEPEFGLTADNVWSYGHTGDVAIEVVFD